MENYKELPEELFAAFLEGKTDSADSMAVLNALINNDHFSDVLFEESLVDDIDDMLLHTGDYGYLELGIDPVFSTDELVRSSSNIEPDDILPEINSIAAEETDLFSLPDSFDVFENNYPDENYLNHDDSFLHHDDSLTMDDNNDSNNSDIDDYHSDIDINDFFTNDI